MGTNYYVIKDKCECCKRSTREYHIGKSSWGWAFSFQGYPWNKLTSWKAWKEFLKDQPDGEVHAREGCAMTDRELLELAAKAAGLKIIKWDRPDMYSHRDGEVAYVCATEENDPWGDEWQPLNDDGDALRLAVKLGIVVEYRREVPACFVYHYALSLEVVQRNDQLDGYDATRRGIVLAAAEIGRKMG